MSDPRIHPLPVTPCLARAYQDEPFAADAVAYWLQRRHGRSAEQYVKTIYLVRQGHGHVEQDDGGVGFPAESVFEWDADLYRRLKQFYADPLRRPELMAAWLDAKRLKIEVPQ